MRFLPRWRPFTWIIVVINVLFLAWVISAGGAAAGNCEGLTGADLDACQVGTGIGATLGIGVIIFFWALIDVILGVVWLVTRSGRRACPACGTDVKKGRTVCRKCGYDFTAATRPPQPPQPAS